MSPSRRACPAGRLVFGKPFSAARRSRVAVRSELGIPDLEHAKVAVIVSLRSFESQRSYRHSIDEFVA